MNNKQSLCKKTNSAYNAPDSFLKHYSKILSVSQKTLLNIITDSNIMICGDTILRNRKPLSKLDFIDYILETRMYY